MESARRRNAIDFGLGAFEVDNPTPEVEELNRRFVAGKITNAERVVMLLALRKTSGRAILHCALPPNVR